MNIQTSAPSELTITGNIKSMDDYSAIKEQAQNVISKGCVELTLKIVDSFSMPSSVIGFLLKLKQKENIRLRMQVTDQRLFTLLNDLNLVAEFGVVKITGQA